MRPLRFRTDAKDLSPSALPWNRPVPIKKSNFSSFKPAGQKFNLETDASRIGSYRSAPEPLPESEILFCDQQLKFLSSSFKRLGSGRSGYFGDHYLKGTGLTPLGANWNSWDTYHSTGHMFPSAALREYIVSVYLKAKGLQSTIVACEGLLLRPLSPALKDVVKNSFNLSASQTKNYRAKIDFKYQAITYKKGPFARATNLIWFMQNMGDWPGFQNGLPVTRFFELLVTFLDPFCSVKTPTAAMTPKEVVDLCEIAFSRTIDNIAKQLHAGIFWGSLGNNVTLDGRFLDLEMPTFLGGPLIGGISTRQTKTVGFKQLQPVGGQEIIEVIGDLMLFVECMKNRIGYLIQKNFFFSKTELEFAAEFLRLLTSKFNSRTHLLYSDRRQIDCVTEVMAGHFKFTASKLLQFRKILRRSLNLRRKFDGRDLIESRYLLLPGKLARPEPHAVYESLFVIDFLRDQIPADFFEEKEFINEIVRDLETHDSQDKFFSSLAEAEKKINRYVKRMAEL